MKKIFSCIILSTVLAVSCSDFLEVIPRDSLVEDLAFTSFEDLEAGLTGVYAAISGSNLVDISSRLSDDLRLGDGNRGQGRQTHDWAFNSGTGEAEGVWINLYTVIARANRVLANMDRLIAEGVVSVGQTNRLRGELLAIRAMSHFDLWRVYSSAYSPSSLAVPYLSLRDLDGNGRPDGLDPDGTPSRIVTSEFFAFVEQDLADARNLLSGSASTDIFRVTNNFIIGLQARIALYKGDYTTAIDRSTEVLANISVASRTDFPGIWSDANNAELVFALRRLPGEGRIGTLFTDLNGDRFFQPAFGLVDLYDEDDDIRFASYFRDDGETVNKYAGVTGNVSLNNIKYMRASELLLIRAESRARDSQFDLAQADLNLLRSRRIEDYEDESFSSIAELVNAIMVERRKELAFEGHRWFDLKRLRMDLERDPRDCVSGAIPCIVEFNDYRWLFPIPQSEIFANRANMVQNPGYSDSE